MFIDRPNLKVLFVEVKRKFHWKDDLRPENIL